MKQIIIADKSLHMSDGKLAVMAAHGAVAYFTSWMRHYVDTTSKFKDKNAYPLSNDVHIDSEMFNHWINGSFTKILLEVNGRCEMEQVIQKAKENGMINGLDFFNIVDESTEFLDIPQWAVIAFRPMKNCEIDPVTRDLNLYGRENSSLNDERIKWEDEKYLLIK